MSVGAADAGLVGHVAEGAVAVVSVEKVLGRADVPGRTEERDPLVAAAMLILRVDPIPIVRDVNIQVAVVVIIEHRPAGGPARPVNAGRTTHVPERAVAVVEVQDIRPVIAQEDIRVGVVVDVADDDPVAEPSVSEAR